MKRLLDLAVAVFLLALLSPLLVAVAAVIRVDSRGPVFYRQSRIGRDQLPFVIYKFRTMIHREELNQHAEAVIEAQSDARITRVGRFLRASSIDELPQLMNIVRNEMSLVGPRPILPEQLEVIPENKMARFRVPPGVTGLAQVNGRRGLDWMEQLAFDVEYAEHHSVLGDLVILYRTVFVVLKGSGVYADKSKNWRAYRERPPEQNEQTRKAPKDQ